MARTSPVIPIVVLLFMTLIIGAYAIGRQRSDLFTTSPSPTQSADISPATQTASPSVELNSTESTTSGEIAFYYPNSPNRVVSNFYSSYLDCVKKHNQTVEETERTLRQDCPIEGSIYSKYLTIDLIRRLDNRASQRIDPILCSADVPESIKIEELNVSSRSATQQVTETFEDDESQLTVNLQFSNNIWEINTITCPLS